MITKYNPIPIEEEVALSKDKPTPYSYEVLKNNKRLLCVGIKHTRDKDHPQFKILENLIGSFKPEYAVFEIPQKALQTLISLGNDELIRQFGEVGIIKGLLNPSVKIIGGDLTTREMFMSLPPNISSEEKEILHLLIITKMRSRITRKPPAETIIEEIKKKDIKNELAFMQKVEYYITILTGKSLHNLSYQDDFIPKPIDKKCILNNIMRTISINRDKNMIQTIIQALHKNDRVIFFAGKNHIIRQENYWRNKYYK